MLKPLKSGIMKRQLLWVFAVITACSTVKKTQQALNSGDFDNAINLAVEKLQNNRTKKGNQPYVYMLEEAFAKASQTDLERVTFLKKEGNPEQLRTIYETYVDLDRRQERIKPLLPLRLLDRNRNARFDMKDYSSAIINSKRKLSDYMYTKASTRMAQARNKYDYRNAYEDFSYVNHINPGYKSVNLKLEESHSKGIDFVSVKIFNDTDKVLPKRLEDELLNFNTYGINDLWTVYHSKQQSGLPYAYEMEIAFVDIDISPERVTERHITKEKDIKDGWKYLRDRKGNIVKDSLGNQIKVDRYKTVRCDYYEFTQFKAVNVTGKVSYTDLDTGQVLHSYPLSSEFVFEHVYSDYDGDKRALDNDLLRLTQLHAVPFPGNEQMVYDAGEDIKQRIKRILKKHRFN